MEKVSIRGFEEVKKVLEVFPEFSGVGYVVMPKILQIAADLGLMGYAETLERWKSKSVFGDVVLPDYTNYDYASEGILLEWEGLPIRKVGNTITIGLRATMDLIWECIGEEKPVKVKVKKNAVQKR